MKNFIVSAMVVMASAASINAQTVNVHMKDGQVIKYDYDKVEYVDFSAEGKANEIKGAVDLGLSVLWAKCNVGANTPEEYGDYYCWGEIATKDGYFESNYFRYVGTRYFNSIGTDISGMKYYDAATAKMGTPWRMPTSAELSELVKKCTWTKTSVNGVAGFNVKGPNGNSIFFPCSGACIDNNKYQGTYAQVWSSTISGAEYNYLSLRLFANADGVMVNEFPAFYGVAVRGVCEGYGEVGGGTGGETGDGWTSVSASGYAPYYYCPTTKKTTPATKVVASNIRAYKNTSTNAYKVNLGGKDYACSRGYNKLTIGTQAHTTQNAYGNSVVCKDYQYFEFTISD